MDINSLGAWLGIGSVQKKKKKAEGTPQGRHGRSKDRRASAEGNPAPPASRLQGRLRESGNG